MVIAEVECHGTTTANLTSHTSMIRNTFSRFAVYWLQQIALIFLVSLICTPMLVRSQDAVRPSLAGEATSEARQQDIERIPYNLLVGPVRFRFSATFGIEYNDNINLADDDTAVIRIPHGPPIVVKSEPEDDVIFRPAVNLDAIWPITQLNTLRLDLGLSYAIYADHSNANTNGVLIAPGSQLAFDVFVGDFRINFHDRPSLQQDPIAEAALSNVVDYGRFENTAGVSVLWDLNKAVVTLGYDHYTYVSTVSDFDYLNRNAEELSGTLGVNVASNTTVGVEAYGVFNYYDQRVLNDSTDYSVGGFIETQLTSYLKVRGAAGYQAIDFDHNGTVGDPHDLSDYYANILISHRLNAAIRQSVSAGHESQLGVNSNFITLNYVRHTVSWNIIRNTLLSTEFFYEDADDSGGFINEHLHRYGGAITVGYQLTPHVTLGLRYQYTQKDSDVVLRDYKQNRVSIDGTYSF
jgi:Putative beta-barrel porin 2